MEPSYPGHDRYQAIIEHIDQLNPETVAIRLACPDIGHYQAGQYLRVFINEHTARCYSLASAPGVDAHLQLHVRRGAVGSASRWFHEVLKEGDAIQISAPQGYCGYRPDRLDQPLLLIATGSGLAPFYGVARSALQHGHRGQIRLYHGVRYGDELYLVDQLRALAGQHPNFHYAPCISRGDKADGCISGRALNAAIRETPLTRAWRVYLSGNPAMVEDGWKIALRAGVPPESILSDQLPNAAATLSTLAA